MHLLIFAQMQKKKNISPFYLLSKFFYTSQLTLNFDQHSWKIE